jgi:hypothetical protein
VCRALQAAYGALHSLRPTDILSSRQLYTLLQSWASRHPRLHTLNLAHIADIITPRSVAALTATFPHLCDLRLTECSKLDDQALLDLAPLSQSLTSVDLSFCTRLTDQAVLNLAPLAPSLALLNLSGCRRLSESALTALPVFTRLVSLTIPSIILLHPNAHYARSRMQLAPLGPISSLTQVRIISINQSQPKITTFLAASLKLRHLRSIHIHPRFGLFICPEAAHLLSRHTQLESLCLGNVAAASGDCTELQALGTLHRLTNLELHVYNSLLSGVSFDWLATLSSMRSLRLSTAADGDVLGSALRALAVSQAPLSILSLSGEPYSRRTPLAPSGIAALASEALIHSLRSLSLSYLLIPPGALAAVSRLRGLTSLHILSCQEQEPHMQEQAQLTPAWTSPGAPTALMGLTSLEFLAISSWIPCPGLGQVIAHLTALTCLVITSCRVGDADLASIASLPQLQRLHVMCNSCGPGAQTVGRAGLAALRRLSCLRELDLRYTMQPGMESLHALLPLAPSLRHLRLGELPGAAARQLVAAAVGTRCVVDESY